MKKILVPTDFSDTAANALQLAASIAKKNNAQILLLHVFHVPVIDVYASAQFIDDIQEEQKKKADEKLKQIVAELEKEGIETEVISKPGLLGDEISEIEKKHNVDFVVMGTTGSSGPLANLIGSNAARTIEKVHCPVMIVPHEAKNRSFSSIAYAYDFVDMDVTTLGELAAFANQYSANITVLHVKKEGHFKFKDEELILESAGKKYNNVAFNFVEIKDDDIAEGIDHAVEDNNCDLVVMTHHHRSFFGRLFHKSLSKRMAYHSHIPLLIYHG